MAKQKDKKPSIQEEIPWGDYQNVQIGDLINWFRQGVSSKYDPTKNYVGYRTFSSIPRALIAIFSAIQTVYDYIEQLNEGKLLIKGMTEEQWTKAVKEEKDSMSADEYQQLLRDGKSITQSPETNGDFGLIGMEIDPTLINEYVHTVLLNHLLLSVGASKRTDALAGMEKDRKPQQNNSMMGFMNRILHRNEGPDEVKPSDEEKPEDDEDDDTDAEMPTEMD